MNTPGQDFFQSFLAQFPDGVWPPDVSMPFAGNPHLSRSPKWEDLPEKSKAFLETSAGDVDANPSITSWGERFYRAITVHAYGGWLQDPATLRFVPAPEWAKLPQRNQLVFYASVIQYKTLRFDAEQAERNQSEE